MSVKTFTERVPPDLRNNPNVVKLLKVLDELSVYKDSELYKLDTVTNPLLLRDRQFLKNFLYEFGQLQDFGGAPYFIIERLIMNAYDIYAYKGTPVGERLFIKSCCDGDIVTDMSAWYPPPYIMPSDLHGYGILPNGNDLGFPGGDFDFGIGVSPCYLFGGSFSTYYGTIKVAIVSPYVGNLLFRQFISRLLPYFLPMCHPYTTNLQIAYYDYGMVPVGSYASLF